jgi:hypothetical protein
LIWIINYAGSLRGKPRRPVVIAQRLALAANLVDEAVFSNARAIFVRDYADMNAPLIIGAAAFLFRYRYFYNDLSGPHSGPQARLFGEGHEYTPSFDARFL